VCTYIHIYTSVCVRTYILHVEVCVYICFHLCTRVCVRMYIYAQVSVCVYTCIHVQSASERERDREKARDCKGGVCVYMCMCIVSYAKCLGIHIHCIHTVSTYIRTTHNVYTYMYNHIKMYTWTMHRIVPMCDGIHMRVPTRQKYFDSWASLRLARRHSQKSATHCNTLQHTSEVEARSAGRYSHA